MKNNWYPVALIVCLSIACAPAPAGAVDPGFIPAITAFTVDEVDLIPEGIARNCCTPRPC